MKRLIRWGLFCGLGATLVAQPLAQLSAVAELQTAHPEAQLLARGGGGGGGRAGGGGSRPSGGGSRPSGGSGARTGFGSYGGSGSRPTSSGTRQSNVADRSGNRQSNISDRQGNRQTNVSDRQGNRQNNVSDRQGNRQNNVSDRQGNRQNNVSDWQNTRQNNIQSRQDYWNTRPAYWGSNWAVSRPWGYGWYGSTAYNGWGWYAGRAAAWGLASLATYGVINNAVNSAINTQSSYINVPDSSYQLYYTTVQGSGDYVTFQAYDGGATVSYSADCRNGTLNGRYPNSGAEAQLLNAACQVAFGK